MAVRQKQDKRNDFIKILFDFKNNQWLADLAKLKEN